MADENSIQDATFVSQSSRAIDPAVLDLDDVFEVLAHSRRRSVLYALAMDDQWTLSALATTLAAWEHAVDEDAVDEHTHDRMYVSLYHVHIPKLEKIGVIRFDEGSETIVSGAYTDKILAVLEGVNDGLNQRGEDP